MTKKATNKVKEDNKVSKAQKQVGEKPKLEKKYTPNELQKHINISPALLQGALSHLGIRKQFYKQPDEPLIPLDEFLEGIEDYKNLEIKI
jgi:hypothetical protein